jgi:hypothetical protein
LNPELEKNAKESLRLHDRFAGEHALLIQRWTVLINEHKSQVDAWALSRPHDDESELRFLEQRKANMLIHDEFRVWIGRLNSTQKRLQTELTPTSESDISTKLIDVKKLSEELIRNLEIELPKLRKIVQRFHESVSKLASLNNESH